MSHPSSSSNLNSHSGERLLDSDRLFPADSRLRDIARELYLSIKNLPIISPHGHCNPQWFAENKPFSNPADLFITPDHYVLRMLASQGIQLEMLGIPNRESGVCETDPRKIWKRFADNVHLFRGTPISIWLDHSFEAVFGINVPLNSETADRYYDHIDACLKLDSFRPRSLFDSFNVEVLSTTEDALDELNWHEMIRESDWNGQIVTTYRPDSVTNPEHEGFIENVEILGARAKENTATWEGYLNAHRNRREYFKSYGATASDHSHPSARTECLSTAEASRLFEKAIHGKITSEEADQFRGHMLTEMARMGLEDGLVLQLHCGPFRNHGKLVSRLYGKDKGFDMPKPVNFIHALKPMLDEVGMSKDLTIIVFTLDESSYSRELAPLAGAYPALRIGPPWWFFDSVEGIRRFREQITETAGFYNTVGFNDDTRAFCSIPARHDVARRCDCSFLANLVGTGRLRMDEALDLAQELTYKLAKKAYRIDEASSEQPDKPSSHFGSGNSSKNVPAN